MHEIINLKQKIIITYPTPSPSVGHRLLLAAEGKSVKDTLIWFSCGLTKYFAFHFIPFIWKPKFDNVIRWQWKTCYCDNRYTTLEMLNLERLWNNFFYSRKDTCSLTLIKEQNLGKRPIRLFDTVYMCVVGGGCIYLHIIMYLIYYRARKMVSQTS